MRDGVRVRVGVTVRYGVRVRARHGTRPCVYFSYASMPAKSM